MSAKLAPYTAALRTKNCFLENRSADLDFGARKPLTGFRARTAGSKSDAFHVRVAAGNFGTKSGDVVCATPAGAKNVAANMAVPNTNR